MLFVDNLCLFFFLNKEFHAFVFLIVRFSFDIASEAFYFTKNSVIVIFKGPTRMQIIF